MLHSRGRQACLLLSSCAGPMHRDGWQLLGVRVGPWKHGMLSATHGGTAVHGSGPAAPPAGGPGCRVAVCDMTLCSRCTCAGEPLSHMMELMPHSMRRRQRQGGGGGGGAGLSGHGGGGSGRYAVVDMAGLDDGGGRSALDGEGVLEGEGFRVHMYHATMA